MPPCAMRSPRFDGIEVDPDGLRVSADEFERATVDTRGRRRDRRCDRPPAGVQRGADGAGAATGRSRANRASPSARRSRRSPPPGCSRHRARPAIRASPTSSPSRLSLPASRRSRWSCPRFPAARGEVDPAVLVVCRKLGIRDVFRVNGPAGIAALGFGTAHDPEGPQDRRARLAGGDDRPGRDAAPRRRHDDAARPDRESGHRRRLRRPGAARRRPAHRGRARHRQHRRADHHVGVARRRRRRGARPAARDAPRRSGDGGSGVARAQRWVRARRRPRRRRRHRQRVRSRTPAGRRRRRPRSTSSSTAWSTPARSWSVSTRRSVRRTSSSDVRRHCRRPGFAHVSSGITADTFLKRTAIARADATALARMTPSVLALADHEGFPAHGDALRLRRS